MIDSYFLCLDIGTCGVRGIAHHVQNAIIVKSAYYSLDNFDTVFALKSVIDEIESNLGTRLVCDTAYITGNFGPSFFKIAVRDTKWPSDHKITSSDINDQLSNITGPAGFYPMHTVPLRYDTSRIRNMLSPVGHTDRQLRAAYSRIFFDQEYLNKILEFLRHAHIQPNAFYTPHFIWNAMFRPAHKTVLFIDFGAEYTTTSIWTDRGPVWYDAPAIAGNDLTDTISKNLNISFSEAERIKRTVANLKPSEMSRFTPADCEYEFSCADVNDLVIPFYNELLHKIKSSALEYLEKYHLDEIIIGGGGASVNGISEKISELFNLPVKILGPDATVRGLGDYIWKMQESHRHAYISRVAFFNKISNRITTIFKRRKKKTTTQFVPIMPSTLCFDMNKPETYDLFKSGGISVIHVDIMDGLYVDKIASGLDELRQIRMRWPGHLHVHLMTEAPSEWAIGAIESGADTIILSTNTSGLRNAIQIIKKANRRVGIALNPESSPALLKTVLRDLDEVMIMGVTPGAAGQKFDQNVLNKISVLHATRRKYGLKFKISVDGGIDETTARMCWDAGADILVSGSYLASAPDFPLAVISLMQK